MQSEIKTYAIWFCTAYDHMPNNQMERLRRIRNSCREFMTRDTHEITIEEQAAWAKSLDRTVCCPFLLWVEGDAIGYGLIRKEGEQWWLSGGLLPEWRGKGWGTILFGLLLMKAPRPVYLEVKLSNRKAVRLYAKLGFTPTQVDPENDRMVMVKL